MGRPLSGPESPLLHQRGPGLLAVSLAEGETVVVIPLAEIAKAIEVMGTPGRNKVVINP